MYWYVMIHVSPAQAELMLQRENNGEFLDDGEQRREEFEYFIPSLFLRRVTVKGAPVEDWEVPDSSVAAAADYNGVREALHGYIFIRASEERISRLLESDWNTTGRLRMYHCRTIGGTPLRVADDEMRRFIDTLKNSQLKYFIGQPLGEMAVGDEVTMHMPLWQGRKGRITRIEVVGGHTRLTVSVDILGNLTSINFTDVREGDVTFTDEESPRLFTGNLLRNFERELLGIVTRRYSKNESVEERSKDKTRIMRLYSYANTRMEDVDDSRRFTALMLLCSHMLHREDARRGYIEQVKEWVPSVDSDAPEAATATEAYLMLVLFVATRKPALRQAVKNYKNSHADCPDFVVQLFAKVKRLHSR